MNEQEKVFVDHLKRIAKRRPNEFYTEKYLIHIIEKLEVQLHLAKLQRDKCCEQRNTYAELNGDV